MANLGYTFDAMQHPVEEGSSSLPVSGPDGYPVVILSDEWKPTKNNDGEFLEFLLEVIDGPFKGARGAHRLNLHNNSAEAVRIAHTGTAGLSALCRVTQRYNLSDQNGGTSQLHRIPFKVVVEQQTGANSKYTQVVKVLDMAGNSPGKPNATQAGQPAPAIPPAANQPPQAGTWQPAAQPPMGQPEPTPAPGQQPGTWQQNQAGAPIPWGPKS